uniref:Uncharacterized protein n=2 Tax=Canis lupus familiaris TaxID=9615 RepID=A0A8C0N4J8_CANLF
MLSDAYCPEDGRPGLFLQDNQLLEVVNKFTKATGATQQDSNASSLVDIYSFWLNCSQVPSESRGHHYPKEFQQ